MAKDKKTILIAEDEAPMLEALITKFTNEGFNVLPAKDGQEAMELANKEHPDLILLDVVMPKIDGLTFLKMIRSESKWGGDASIVMLTNLSDPQTVSEAANYHVYDFLVKTDWKLDDVVKMVKQKLNASS
jgi:DNA-binding response OmpR family regulator